MLHTISLINASTVCSDSEIVQIARALQRQINRDYRPFYGTNAAVVPIFKGATPPPNSWWLVVADDMDVAGALGYHDLTPDLLPVGKVGAKLDLEDGASISVTCSHECLEMLGDPGINLLAEDPRTRRVYAYENCDAVEADGLGYSIDGVLVSDFVLPAYFEPEAAKIDVPVSFRGNVTKPFEIATGGYLSYFLRGDGGWKQVTAEGEFDAEVVRGQRLDRPEGQRPSGFPEGSRRERRLRKSEGQELRPSTAHA